MHIRGVADHDGSRSAIVPQEGPVVFVVEDDVSVRESLGALIRSAGMRSETFEFGREFLSSPQAAVPSCVIVDARLPDLNGLDLQKHVSTERGCTPVIFITGYGDVPMTVAAMRAGAVDVLTKPFNDEVMLTTIRQAIQRSRTLLALETEQRALQARHASLSAREQEVLVLVVSGLMNKQIAFELGISEITVKAHRGKVMRKMQAKSLADLIKMATQLRLTN